jgi:streptogramin lyase
VWAALSTGSLARVDTTSGTVTRIGSLPSTPFDVEPTDEWVWVSLPLANQILALDPVDGHVVHTVTTASPGPRGLTLAGGSLWCSAGTALLELDAGTGAQLRRVPLPAAGLPYDLAVSADSVWVTDASTTSVTRYLLTDGRVEQIDVGGPSVGVVLAGGTVWVARKDAAHLVRLDASTGRLVSRPTLPSPALGLATIGSEVWAGVPEVDQVMSFDADTGQATRSWRVGDFPPIVTGDDQSIYVSSNHTNQIIRVPQGDNPVQR